VLVVAAIILSGGVGFIAYLAAWIIMPLDRDVILTPPPMSAGYSPQAQY
jgi:hypothetical protein